MKIKLLHRYRGHLTDNQWMESGEHDLEKDFASYLVNNGHAIYIKDVSPVIDNESVEDSAPTEKESEPEPPKVSRRNRK